MNKEQLEKAVESVETLSELLAVPTDAIIEKLSEVSGDDMRLDQIYTAIYGE